MTAKPEAIYVDPEEDSGNPLIKCPSCGHVTDLDNYDCIGADPGCIFCNQCHTEMEQ